MAAAGDGRLCIIYVQTPSIQYMPPASPDTPHPVIVVMGVSGCGKTVVGELLADTLGVPFRDADHFHPPENVERMRSGRPLDDAARGPWLDRLARLIDDAVRDGSGLVLACSALKRAYRDRLGAARPGVRLVFLDGDESLIRERIEQRTGHYMPASLLASQCALLERPTAEERPITIDVASPPESLAAAIVAALRRPD